MVKWYCWESWSTQSKTCPSATLPTTLLHLHCKTWSCKHTTILCCMYIVYLLTSCFVIQTLSLWRFSNVWVCDCSLFAVEAGAERVFACDCSSSMIQIASDVLHANGVTDKVTLINKLSTDIIIPVDMPSRWLFSTNYIQFLLFLLCVCDTSCLYNLNTSFPAHFDPGDGGSKFL